jgi:hypothetical protein
MAVKVEVQVAEAVVPARVQVVKLPVTPVSERLTVPVGVTKVPAVVVSVTVTVHVDPVFTSKGVVHETVVEVARTVIVTKKLPPLNWCVVSPG